MFDPTLDTAISPDLDVLCAQSSAWSLNHSDRPLRLSKLVACANRCRPVKFCRVLTRRWAYQCCHDGVRSISRLV